MTKSIELDNCKVCHEERVKEEPSYDFPEIDPVYEYNSHYYSQAHLPPKEQKEAHVDFKFLRAPNLDKLLVLTKCRE